MKRVLLLCMAMRLSTASWQTLLLDFNALEPKFHKLHAHFDLLVSGQFSAVADSIRKETTAIEALCGALNRTVKERQRYLEMEVIEEEKKRLLDDSITLGELEDDEDKDLHKIVYDRDFQPWFSHVAERFAKRADVVVDLADTVKNLEDLQNEMEALKYDIIDMYDDDLQSKQQGLDPKFPKRWSQFQDQFSDFLGDVQFLDLHNDLWEDIDTHFENLKFEAGKEDDLDVAQLNRRADTLKLDYRVAARIVRTLGEHNDHGPGRKLRSGEIKEDF